MEEKELNLLKQGKKEMQIKKENYLQDMNKLRAKIEECDYVISLFDTLIDNAKEKK